MQESWHFSIQIEATSYVGENPPSAQQGASFTILTLTVSVTKVTGTASPNHGRRVQGI